jgi:hypothetical protein
MTHEHEFNCKDMVKNLNTYIDGDLDDVLCSEIEDHISSCSNCQIVVNTLKKTIQIYQSDGRETKLPTDMRKRLFSSLGLDEYAQRE